MQEKLQRVLISLIFVVMAYEWLISGFNKVLSVNFITGLHNEFSQSIPDIKYPLYAAFLKHYCLPHCEILGGFIEIGEILIGISFVALAIYTFKGHANTFMMRLGILTGFASAFMSINFFLYQSGSVFLNPTDPFDEGISIDFILFLMGVGISLYYYLALYSIRKFHPQTNS